MWSGHFYSALPRELSSDVGVVMAVGGAWYYYYYVPRDI